MTRPRRTGDCVCCTRDRPCSRAKQPPSSEKSKKINVVVASVTLVRAACCTVLHGRCSVQQMQQAAKTPLRLPAGQLRDRYAAKPRTE
jgi:hypothetical protein